MSDQARGILITHPDYARHLTGPHHPERPERLKAIEALLRRTPLWEALAHRSPEPVADEILARVHTPAYIARVRETAMSGGGHLDPDTPVSPVSYDVARLAAGGALLAVDGACAGDASRDAGAPVAMALIRPPGHHAGPQAGMGFCLFNNAALAARHALEVHGQALGARGRGRVMILDWDVHHGNGTQEVFYRDPSVVFCSLHQENWYPGTGALTEIGEGPGEGTTINIPLPAGIGDGGYLHLWEEIVLPLIKAVAPGLLVISAGFDAHHRDPLGGMLLTAAGFGRLAGLVREAVRPAPIVAILEGGYDLDGLAHSVSATLEGLTGLPPSGGIAAGVAEPAAEVREAPFSVARARAREIRHVLGAYWQF